MKKMKNLCFVGFGIIVIFCPFLMSISLESDDNFDESIQQKQFICQKDDKLMQDTLIHHNNDRLIVSELE
ncbi:hypothetical protein PAMA111031_06415 [Paraphotobacterium marinum]